MDTILDNLKVPGAEPADAFVPSDDLAGVQATVDRANRTSSILADKEQRSAFHRNAARER